MQIKNHRIEGAPFVKSPNISSGTLTPKGIVMHYTAGYTAESAISTLTKPNGKSSAHVVVDLDGTITQLVEFDNIAWHAGPSKYKEFNGLNKSFIGIEIVNIGFLRKLASGQYQDAYGNKMDAKYFEDLIEAPHARVGSGNFYWPTYPEAQLKAVEELTEALIDTYNLKHIVTHEEIDTRGWKTDPGPAFPMKRFTKLLNADDRNLDSNSEPDITIIRWVNVDALNVRSGPGADHPIIGSLTKGTKIHVSKIDGGWAKLVGEDKWVSAKYLTF